MARALLLQGPGRFSWADRPDAHAGVGEVLVRPRWTGLCGTDLHILDGLHPRARFPLALGHELAAIVETGNLAGRVVLVDPLFACGACPSCRRGAPNVCGRGGTIGIDRDGGLGGLLAIREERLHPLPDQVPDHIVPLGEPLAVAIHAVRRVPSVAGATVAVLGAGPVGLLLAHVARRDGARVLIAEVSPSRRAAAAGMGFALLDADRPLEDCRSATGLEGADVVFDAAGSAALGPMLTAFARRGGTLAMVAAHAHPVAFDLADVMFRELSVVGQRAYLPTDVRAAVVMLGEDVAALSPLVTDRLTADDVPAALERLRAGEGLRTVVACPG